MTYEEKVKMTVGELALQSLALSAQNEELMAQLAAKSQELEEMRRQLAVFSETPKPSLDA